MDLRKDLEALKQASLSSLFEEADLERVFNAGKQNCPADLDRCRSPLFFPELR